MQFRDLWTEKDGVSLDWKRVFAAPMGLLSPLGLQIMAILKGQTFDASAFCTGYGVVIAALAGLFAAHSAAKGENEPD